MKRRRALVYLVAAPLGFAAAALVAFLLNSLLDAPGASMSGAVVDRPVPAFVLPGLDGGEAGLASADLAGAPAVLNLFASWCVPCLAEHPFLMSLATREDVAVYGIAWMDDPADTTAWLAEHGSPYARVGMDRTGTLRRALDVQGVPTTFIVDAGGRIRFARTGPLVADHTIAEFLAALEKARP